MLKNLRIQIPEPCHEDWNKMTPDEKGRHCSSCDKIVIDFTTYSNEELIQYFSRPELRIDKGCGHFKKTQLNKTYTLKINPSNKDWTFQKLFLFSFILIFGNGAATFAHDIFDTSTVRIECVDTIVEIDSCLSADTLQCMEIDSCNTPNDTNAINIKTDKENIETVCEVDGNIIVVGYFREISIDEKTNPNFLEKEFDFDASQYNQVIPKRSTHIHTPNPYKNKPEPKENNSNKLPLFADVQHKRTRRIRRKKT